MQQGGGQGGPPVQGNPELAKALAVKWQTPLFDITSEPGGCGMCCYTLWCTSCAFGNNVDMLQPGEAPCAGNCFMAAVTHFLLGSVISQGIAALTGVYLPLNASFLLHMRVRRGIRTKYNLLPFPCHDCLVTFFCSPCAVCQEYRELTIQQNPMAHPLGPPMQPGMVWGPGQAPGPTPSQAPQR